MENTTQGSGMPENMTTDGPVQGSAAPNGRAAENAAQENPTLDGPTSESAGFQHPVLHGQATENAMPGHPTQRVPAVENVMQNVPASGRQTRKVQTSERAAPEDTPLRQKYRRMALRLDIAFVAGLLAHSIILFVMNARFDPATGSNALYSRIMMGEAAEGLFFLCFLVYFVGNIRLTVLTATGKIKVPRKTVASYFGVQFVLMAVCTLPPAWLDGGPWGDYLGPLLWPAVGILILFAVGMFIQARRR